MATDETTDRSRSGGSLRSRLFGDSDTRVAYSLVSPTVAWYAVFLLLPLTLVGVYSFLTYTSYATEFVPTLDVWQNTVFTSFTLDLFVRTLWIGVVVTGLCLLFGYPFAYYLRFHASNTTGLVLLLFVIIPFWTPALIRTSGWLPLLGRGGVVNTLLVNVGIINEPLSWLLFSRFSQLVGYLQSYIVFMAAPIYISLTQVDDDLISASETLRGGPYTTFRRVVWPLSLPGVAIGTIFVFVLSIGDIMVPEFLSGGTLTVPTRIYQAVNGALNYPIASALSITMLCVIFVCVFVVLRFVDISEIVSV